MSQEKVDRYKEEKKNRAQNMKKEKREIAALKIGGTVIALLLVFWVGYSVYQSHESSIPAATYQIKSEALDDFMNTMSETETEAESEADTEAAEQSTEAASESTEAVTETVAE